MQLFLLFLNRECQSDQIRIKKYWEMVMTDISIGAYLKWFYECFCASSTGCRGERIGRVSYCLVMRMIRCLASLDLNVRLVKFGHFSRPSIILSPLDYKYQYISYYQTVVLINLFVKQDWSLLSITNLIKTFLSFLSL